MTGDYAIEILRTYGPEIGDVIEVHPDNKAKVAGDRWFMIVKKHNLVEVNGKLSVDKCQWCKTNSLQPCKIFKDLTHCPLENVKAWGRQTAKIFAKFATASSLKANVPTQASIRTPATAANPATLTVVPVIAFIPTPATLSAVPVIPWKEVTVGLTNSQGGIAPASQTYVLKQKAITVAHVEFHMLQKAMNSAQVPGAKSAQNKDDLIKLMCKYNCEFAQNPEPLIQLGRPSTVSTGQVLGRVESLYTPVQQEAYLDMLMKRMAEEDKQRMAEEDKQRASKMQKK